MAQKYIMKSNVKLVISLLIGILINPLLFLVVVFVDVKGSDSDQGDLLDRTPFAWTYFWSSIFINYRSESFFSLVLAIITNTVMYFILSYVLLTIYERYKKLA